MMFNLLRVKRDHKGMRTAKALISLHICAYAQADQSLCCSLRKTGSLTDKLLAKDIDLFRSAWFCRLIKVISDRIRVVHHFPFCATQNF